MYKNFLLLMLLTNISVTASIIPKDWKLNNTRIYAGKKRVGYYRTFSKNVKVTTGKTTDFSRSSNMLNVHIPEMEEKNKCQATVYFYPDSQIPGKKYTASIWIKSGKKSGVARLFITGHTSTGKHYYIKRFFNINSKWQKLSISDLIPKDLPKFLFRIDLVAGAEYFLTEPSIKLNTTIPVKETLKVRNFPGNLILNGGAERGWYQTGAIGKQNSLIENKYITVTVPDSIKGRKKLVPAPEWSSMKLDKKIKHSGRASFRIKVPKYGKGQKKLAASLLFNPVPVGPFKLEKDISRNNSPALFGKQVNLSFWAKSKNKGRLTASLFGGSGCAYAKNFNPNNKWRKYTITIPRWGEKIKGVIRHGNPKNHSSVESGLFTPRFVFRGDDNTYWIDDVKYWLGKGKEPVTKQAICLSGQISNNKYRYFHKGEVVKFDLNIDNQSRKSRKLQVSYCLIDYFGRKHQQSKTKNIFIAADTIEKRSFSVTPKLTGPISISCRIKDSSNGKVYTHNYILGIIARETVIYPQLGVNIVQAFNLDESIEILKDFGFGSVRCWARSVVLNNQYLGNYGLKKYKKAGLYVLYCINSYTGFTHSLIAPKDLGPWGKFVERNVKLNRGLVDAYEILNEPNIWASKNKLKRPDTKYITIDDQAKTIRKVAEIVAANDPGTKIAGPTVAGTNLNWVEAIFDAGGNKYLDIITEHPYRDLPESPDYAKDLMNLKRLIAQYYEKTVPIYASEAGRITVSMPVDNLLNNEQLKMLVAWNIRNQIVGFSNGLNKYFHFNWQPTTIGTGWLMTWQGNPGNDYKVIPCVNMYGIHWMGYFIGKAKALGAVALDDSLRCYIFEKNQKRIVALWKWRELDKETTLTFSNAKNIKAFDLFGNPCGKKKGYALSLKLDYNPIYLTSELPRDELRSRLSTSDISGLGMPARLSLDFIGQNNILLKVKNGSNKAISGSCQILNTTHAPLYFKKLASGKSAVFKLQPAGINKKNISVRTTIADSDLFAVNKFNLRVQTCPRVKTKIKLDGELSEWPEQCPLVLNYHNMASKNSKDVAGWTKKQKIQAKIYTAWDKQNLYFAAVVNKNKCYWPQPGDLSLWEFDSLQIAFDPLKNATENRYGDDDYEYDISFAGKPVVFRRYAASLFYDGVSRKLGLNNEVKVKIKQKAGQVIYEIMFPQATLSPFKLESGKSMLFNLIVNLSRRNKRIGWLEIAPGIGQDTKRTKDFINLYLTN